MPFILKERGLPSKDGYLDYYLDKYDPVDPSIDLYHNPFWEDELGLESIDFEDSQAIFQTMVADNRPVIEIWFWQGNTYRKQYKYFKNQCIELVKDRANKLLKDICPNYFLEISECLTGKDGLDVTNSLIFEWHDENIKTEVKTIVTNDPF